MCRITGDLLDQDVDVIVNAWNRNIIPWWLLLPQGVSGAIKRRGGTGPFKELARHGSIPLGGAVLTSAGRLPFKAIIHVAGINMLWRASEWSIRQSVRNAMALAVEKGFNSIAFPLIGAGSGGFNQERARAIMEDELGKMDSQMEVRLVVFRKPARSPERPESREMSPSNQKADSPQHDHPWAIRQVARRLRYRTMDQLVGRTITLHSLRTVLADMQLRVDEFCPGSIFKGPDQPFREGALAKYGLMDLSYDAPSEMAAAEPHRGLSLLKELGLVEHFDDAVTRPFDKDGERQYFAGLLDELDRNQTILRLFLKEHRESVVTPAERQQWLDQPSSMQFPKTMEIVDACITNLDSVWLTKHFYM